MKQEFASLIRQAVTQTILDLSFSSLWDRSKHITLKKNCTLLLSPLPFVLMLFCHSWASVPVLGQLPVDRRQARPLSLPRASLHGHRHPQRAASLHHVSPVPVMSGHFIWTFKCRTAWIGSVCVCYRCYMIVCFPSPSGSPSPLSILIGCCCSPSHTPMWPSLWHSPCSSFPRYSAFVCHSTKINKGSD